MKNNSQYFNKRAQHLIIIGRELTLGLDLCLTFEEQLTIWFTCLNNEMLCTY